MIRSAASIAAHLRRTYTFNLGKLEPLGCVRRRRYYWAAEDCSSVDRQRRLLDIWEHREALMRAHYVDRFDKLPACLAGGTFLRYGFQRLKPNRSQRRRLGINPF